MINFLTTYKEAAISVLFFLAAAIAEFLTAAGPVVYLPLYIISYFAVGRPVWIKAFRSIRKGSIFSEFLLMGIATVGAFALGKYAEGVAVMLFYMIGEYVQHGAVHRAKSSITSLIDEQPEVAEVERNSRYQSVHPSEVQIGEVIRVKPGQKVPLDGELLTGEATVNTAALTGESKPMRRTKGEEIWAGTINQNKLIKIKVSSCFEDTKLAHIFTLVQEAVERKAPTQRFISKFANIYTPIVVWLAVSVVFLPWFIVQDYVFQDWFYRALIFLVISCPCGLVISIPLGYFGGIGAASRNGILFKGSDFLDQLRKMNTLFMDKTGTLTEGRFSVQKITPVNGFNETELIQLIASLEQQSTHPIAYAILHYANGQQLKPVSQQQEISGRGLKGVIENKQVLAGNRELLEQEQIAIQGNETEGTSTHVYLAVDNTHAGTIVIADTIRNDGRQAVDDLRRQGLEQLIMLSGDNQSVTDSVAAKLGLDQAFGGLLPDEKYEHVKQAQGNQSTVGFMGDGVNDAPVITLADVGLAMGGIGSDATIETADVVIQTDQPSKIPLAIEIAHFTHRVVWQNIGIALGIKVAVMVMAAMGYASMWAAIFADVGVALIAIGNAVRVQQKFSTMPITDLVAFSSDSGHSPQEQASCCGNC